jgi:hypothetical protein
MRTFLFGNKVAVWNLLAAAMLPVGTNPACNTVGPVVPAELVVPPAVPIVPPDVPMLPPWPTPPIELVVPPPLVPPGVPALPPAAPAVPPPLLLPPTAPAVPPLLAVVAPSPMPPVVFIVPACPSSIGVRKQASPLNDSATATANQRHSQIMTARLSEE